MLIAGVITEAFISIGIWIVSGIYKVAAVVFEIFLILSSGTLLEENAYKQIIENFYIVLGIIMLFILAFGLLKGMINPDDQKQGTSTVKKVIVNLITSSIIMALLPTIFSYAYSFQTSFITNYNVIGKFFGYGNLNNNNNDNPTAGENYLNAKRGAYQIVNGVFTAFFNVNMEECISDGFTDFEECQGKLEADEQSYIDNQKDYHTFSNTMKYVEKTGSFSIYKNFAGNVDDNKIDFNFLLSIIAGIILFFVGVSYCFDMALRLVKLVFYQLIAPIPIFFRVIPEGKLSSTFNQWVKATITCYLEVFIRIFIFYFCIYLCQEMINSTFLSDVFNYGSFIGLLAKAFVLMGIVMFMRQAPKLFSEITGIDSGNMKLGIRDKMAGAGLFTAGAVVGGGITALSRNAFARGGQAVNKWKEVKGTTGKEKRKAVLGALGASVGVLGSTIGGTVSGATRSGKAGKGAKSFKDMKASASSGAAAAVSARDKRSAYKASHGDNTIRAIGGHVVDTIKGAGEWAGISAGDATLGYYDTAAQSTDSFNSMAEGTYKKKQEYVDKSSQVKDIESKYNMLKTKYRNALTKHEQLLSKENRTEDENKELIVLANDIIDLERQTKDTEQELIPLKEQLLQMQIDMSYKKKDIISIAATKLSVDQKVNYSGDKEFKEVFEKSVYEGFGIKDAQNIKKVENKLIEKIGADGKKYQENQKTISVVVGKDEHGKDIIEEKLYFGNDVKIIDALLSGQEVKDEWITKENVTLVQDVLDKANIERQHIKAGKERTHIINKGNQSAQKKDK